MQLLRSIPLSMMTTLMMGPSPMCRLSAEAYASFCYKTTGTVLLHKSITQDFNTPYQELSSGTGVQDSPRLNPSAMVIWEVTAAPMISRYSSAYFIVDAN